MLTPERLRVVLEKLGLADVQIRIDGRSGHFVASVVSPDFAAVHDVDRQGRIWGGLMANLTEYEQGEVEFVFTSTPAETADLSLGH